MYKQKIYLTIVQLYSNLYMKGSERMSELIKAWVQKEVLTPQEVGKLLGVSRQQISNLVAQGKLVPVKSVPGCNLFLLEDVEKYRIEKTRSYTLVPKTIYGSGITRHCTEYVQEQLKDVDKIVAVYIYFDDYDAIMDGFYTTRKIVKRDKLMSINAPTFIIKYEDLEEIWFRGFNCGYGGVGPSGSETTLIKIGVPPDMARMVYSSNVIKYYKEGGTWNYTAEWRFDDEGRVKPLRNFDRPHYIFNNNLVITQEHCGVFWKDCDPLSFVKKNLGFLSEPYQIVIYSRAKAIETGHYILSNVEEQYFCVIIKDRSGKEMWLDCPVDEKKSIARQLHLKELFEFLEVDYPTEGVLSELGKKLLGISLSVQTFGIGKQVL